jgi:3-deoxy-D-arabino-heptulosonate 7-phosphate (DAHP) synthase
MSHLLHSYSGSIVIAGPCALESREQLRKSVRVLKKMGVSMVRASLWKPRTQPGWDGLGGQYLPVLLEETLPHGMIPATEIMSGEDAQMVVDALRKFGDDARMIAWLGARNQNHMEQRRIARILADGPTGIQLMFKNQIWKDEAHWLGIFEHLRCAGFPYERLIACHRGFCPGDSPNPHGLRNLPDFQMAMRFKEKTGLPVLLDPSHISGTRKNIKMVCEMAGDFRFDGYLIEMHCDAANAVTDAGQQLSPEELHELLSSLDYSSEMYASLCCQ